MQAADDDNSDLSAQLNKLEQQLEKTGTKLSQQRKKSCAAISARYPSAAKRTIYG